MSPRIRRIVLIVVLLLAALVVLLLFRCSGPKPAPAPKTAAGTTKSAVEAAPAARAVAPDERLTPATIQVPAQVVAGSTFQAAWTGPDNQHDFLTIVRPTAKSAEYGNYRETQHGTSLELKAPIEAGEWEVRYVTSRSRTVLARAALSVTATAAEFTAPDEVFLGAPVSISWSGPNHAGDYVCIVPKDAPDDQVRNYGEASKGSPLVLRAPIDQGEAEIRYISGQGRKVLGRRKIMVLAPDTSVAGPATAIAGARFAVTWTGPANAGDYITVVPRGTPHGQYRNYTDTSKGSPLELTAPMETGEAEIRYMTGTGARVLAWCSISIVAATVSLDAPAETIAGAAVKITWVGPANRNDYITIVAATLPDGRYGNYTDVAKGSPLVVTAPMAPGAAEIRYMSGQGAKVLARRPLKVVPALVSIQAPRVGATGSIVTIEWAGPNNRGDYLTIVPKAAKDGTTLRVAQTARGSPAKVGLPNEPGLCEIRYMSGQGNLVLARAEIEAR